MQALTVVAVGSSPREGADLPFLQQPARLFQGSAQMDASDIVRHVIGHSRVGRYFGILERFEFGDAAFQDALALVQALAVNVPRPALLGFLRQIHHARRLTKLSILVRLQQFGSLSENPADQPFRGRIKLLEWERGIPPGEKRLKLDKLLPEPLNVTIQEQSTGQARRKSVPHGAPCVRGVDRNNTPLGSRKTRGLMQVGKARDGSLTGSPEVNLRPSLFRASTCP
ncbi:MAG: hypothetical protein AUH21_02340 [Nitrospirae bacterium 13_2_20CM_62_7]|nr:MAG: hypothetical protein AUH21_02340 [Nitrospirae bacterium 13_2_20CM_62_7]